MAALTAALPYITAATAVIGVDQQLQQGRQAAAQAQLQAVEHERDANAEAAAAQREAAIERRRARNLMSRARAVAAASGAGASDPTVVNALTDIETQGEMNALNALWSGNTTAQALRTGADVARRTGRASRTAGNYRAASTALAGATDWFTKYGA